MPLTAKVPATYTRQGLGVGGFAGALDSHLRADARGDATVGTAPVFSDIRPMVWYCPNMETSDLDSPASDDESAAEQPFRLYSAASIGPAIRHFREQAGLTQAELAELAGLNRTYLSNLEQGTETEQLRRVLLLLKLLGVRATLQKADW